MPFDPSYISTANPLPVNVVLGGSGGGGAASQGTAAMKTPVAGSASSGIILAANVDRIVGFIHNFSTVILYLRDDGLTVSAANWTHMLNPGEQIAISWTKQAISGIWESATGFAQVSETTA